MCEVNKRYKQETPLSIGTSTLGFLFYDVLFVTDRTLFCSGSAVSKFSVSPYAWIMWLGRADCVRAPASASQKKTQPLLRRARFH
jgi:hypothetical protein